METSSGEGERRNVDIHIAEYRYPFTRYITCVTEVERLLVLVSLWSTWTKAALHFTFNRIRNLW